MSIKDDFKKPSDFCKAKGLKLTEVSALSKQSEQTLNNWWKNKPELFELVVLGAAEKKEEIEHE